METTEFIYKGDEIITKEEFLNVSLKNISQVYHGKRDCCRCGCGGEYFATTFMIEPRSEVNNEHVAKLLKRAKNKVIKGDMDVDFNDTYVDVQVGKDKTITIYFDEVKH